MASNHQAAAHERFLDGYADAEFGRSRLSVDTYYLAGYQHQRESEVRRVEREMAEMGREAQEACQ